MNHYKHAFRQESRREGVQRCRRTLLALALSMPGVPVMGMTEEAKADFELSRDQATFLAQRFYAISKGETQYGEES